NTTTNISPNGSLRIIADIANVYDQATYTAHTVGDGCPGGQVFPEPGCLLIFADGGDYNSSPTVLITAQVGAPYIVTQPVDAFVNVGETAVFTVEAINSVTGDATGLHYNWYEYVDGVSDIPVGTDSATLSLPGVDLSYDGKQYYCDVFNASYTVTSDLAYLTVRRKVAHWQFEDDMIDIVDGWTGEYIDPNVSNPTPTPVYNAAGIDGKAFEFSVDPPTLIRVINSNDGSFDFYPHGLTASCWVKSTQPQTEIYTYPLLYGNPHESSGDEITRGWCIQNKTDSETVGGHVFDVGATIYSSALTNDEWHMVTLTHAGGTIAFYADGQLMGSYTDTTPTFTLMDSLVLMGALPNGVRSFNGLLDDVRIYNYPLNAYEVATLYTDFVPGATICAEPVVNDINGDCIVNLLDFAEIAAAWLECNEVPTCLTVNPQ
ncbi:MAG: LamG domain-containing protein, partial [Sedimentisphaerales bacterium]|nr:LamG domain-containing protein [Sedimentisphaerales bacterium]